MLSFLHKILPLVRVIGSTQSALHARFVLPYSCTLSSNAKNNESFTVSYLAESCRLSPDSALTVSGYLNLQNYDNPDRVLAFLKAQGFSDIQIAKVVRGYAFLLLRKPEKNLLPKFEFFYSKGFSKQDIAHILSKQPDILGRSLKNYIIPLFDFFKSLFESDKLVASVIKLRPFVIRENFQASIVPRIDVLQEYGIPRSNIVWLLRWHPQLLLGDIDILRSTVHKLQEFGFNTESSLFVAAFAIMRSITKASWDKKVCVYKRWGWSDETVIKAFLKQPLCMARSEEKINAVMDYFVNKLGCDSLVIAFSPNILSYSMGRRIIPRTSIVQILQNKGFLAKTSSWSSPLGCSEGLFLQKYIHPYDKRFPELMEVYGKRLYPEAPGQGYADTKVHTLLATSTYLK